VDPLTGPARGAGDRRRLGIRLAATFAALAAGWTVLAGWAVSELVDRSLERRTAEALAHRLGRVETEMARLGRDVTATLERLGAALLAHEPSRLARLRAGGSEVVDEASRIAATTNLDLLTVLDDRETVVSSKHWPQLAGLREPSLGELVGRGPVLRRVGLPRGGKLAVVARRSLPVGEDTLALVGGRWLDASFAEAVALGHQAIVFDLEPGGAEPIVADRTSLGSLDAWRRLARDGAAEEVLSMAAADGSRIDWVAGRRTLRDDGGRVQGAVVVSVPRAGPSPARIGLVFAAVGIVAAALAAAAGFWMAARVSRPVDRLVHAVDAIAAGEADYTFPARAEHELDRLAQSFSRLQRSLELQRRRSAAAERVAAWKDVARRVAHEIKNPLVPIRLTVENLTRARGRDAQLFDELFEEGSRTILEEVEQLRRLVTEFSEFARLPPPQPRRVELHELIDGVLELHAAEPGLEIVRSYGERAMTVEVDAEQFGRALKNVVGNAVEAMRAEPPPRRLEIHTKSEGGMVELRVCDSGTGIPPDAVEKVFEPYFTTKPDGTGLGMAIVYRIVTEHGGVVDAGNRPEGGARVRIRLPVATPPPGVNEGTA
jgi:signal transduction histidine kinase